eukprot:34918-Pleurochrysis_carterae.AAC.2
MRASRSACIFVAGLGTSEHELAFVLALTPVYACSMLYAIMAAVLPKCFPAADVCCIGPGIVMMCPIILPCKDQAQHSIPAPLLQQHGNTPGVASLARGRSTYSRPLS